MSDPRRGEVWIVDLGLVAKVRPCLVLSVETTVRDRALATLVPHTTAVRGTQFEAVLTVRFLKAGAFDVQNLITVPHAKLVRRLGLLSDAEMEPIVDAVRRWLGL